MIISRVELSNKFFLLNSAQGINLEPFLFLECSIEVKGFYTEQVIAKAEQFPYKLKFIDYGNIKPYLEYVINTYGKNFIELYDNKDCTTKVKTIKNNVPKDNTRKGKKENKPLKKDLKKLKG